MFVPYEPELCFDVYRPTDNCVCGADGFGTYDDGINKGYCKSCAKKRKEFIDKIIGDIMMPDNESNIVINTLEQMRKNILQERFCYMVDQYFVSHENEPFSEPYEQPAFIEKVYREKQCLMQDFIFPAFTKYVSGDTNKKKDIERQFSYYYKRLCEMYDEDDELFEEAIFLRTGTHTWEYDLKHRKNI